MHVYITFSSNNCFSMMFFMKNGQQAEMILAVDKRQGDHRTKMVFKVHLRQPRDERRAGSDSVGSE
jgi:hypothetical protein